MLRSNSLALLQLDYPVDTIWRSHNGVDAAADDDAGQVYCCVHRAGRFDIGVTRLSRGAFETLQSLADTAIGESHGAGDEALAQQIFGWIRRGWITGFEVA